MALAAIETFVNLEPKFLPKDLFSIEGLIPDELEIARLELKRLPKNWRQSRDESLQRIGDEWIAAGKTVALLVPSAPIANESNVLLNPAHREFRRVSFEQPMPFQFDPRMLR